MEEPYLLTPQLALRVAILGFVALALFAVLFLRLWALQVLSGDTYLTEADNNHVRKTPLDAPRGAIIDRNGRVLVRNVQGTSLEVWPADLPKSRAARAAELQRLSTVVDIPLKRLEERIQAQSGDPVTPVVIRRGIHEDQRSYVLEHEYQFPGVTLENSYLRQYPHHTLAAHVLGHVGEIDADELKVMQRRGYKLGDIIGQAGVEATYDSYLRGRDGSQQLTVDSRGRPTGQLEPTVLPRKGYSLRLTLDINLQRAAEQALREGIYLAKVSGAWAADGGAIVALDPRDGSVLALASYPTFEPSVYVTRDPRKLEPLQNEAVATKDNHPGLNRALDAAYPPGSTWKPVTALAAMQEHLITPYSALPCTPEYKAYDQVFKNWNPYTNGWIQLPTALAESCDTYFYRVGDEFFKLPPSAGHPLQNWASRFGFGTPTGIDVGPESAGLVPTPEWRCAHYGGPPCKGYIDRLWKPGYSIQMAIGQGDLTVTPIQMARFYAMIANGGALVTPHIVEDVEQPTGDPKTPEVLQRFTAPPPTPTGVDKTALSIVRTGLFEATHSPIGTSSGVFGNFPVSISGKTGTAEKLVTLPGETTPRPLDQSWWCGYGPSENAQIVVCAMIENGGHGGVAAAPAALKVFQKYFKVRNYTASTSHLSD